MRFLSLFILLCISSTGNANEIWGMPFDKIVLSGAARNLYEETRYVVTAITRREEIGVRIDSIRFEIGDIDITLSADDFSDVVDPQFGLARLDDDCCIMGRSFYFRLRFGSVLNCEIEETPEPMKLVFVEIDAQKEEANTIIFNPCDEDGV